VNSPSSSLILAPRFGLLPRLLSVTALLAIETLLISGLIQSPALDELAGAAKFTHDIQHWAFRFAIAYVGSFTILLYLRSADRSRAAPSMTGVPVRAYWLLLHVALLAPFAVLSYLLYRGGAVPFPLLALGWHACGLAAALALFAGAAPLKCWADALRTTGALPLYALWPAAGAILVFKLSQSLWGPAAILTFRLAHAMLLPFIPSVLADPATLTLSTDRFAVQVSEVCSGLEGVGLMLVFCTAWLWYFRREYIFPRALTIVPLAVLAIFLLNSVRIAALVLIGDAGYARMATIGFHSQAGWIAFNLAALGVAYVTKHSRWLSRTLAPRAVAPDAVAPDATAAYLVPFLAILAAGMLSRALSAGFDLLYSLRLVCALVALWAYRRSYRNIDWGFSWRGVVAGVAVFGVWAACAQFVSPSAAMPDDLARLPFSARVAWIACRAATAIIMVPIAEELAYRGFLMRRIEAPDFDSIPMSRVGWPAIAISAVAFGVMHGGLCGLREFSPGWPTVPWRHGRAKSANPSPPTRRRTH
jgi:exosortase E/protease (VPEID-CTERM system)